MKSAHQKAWAYYAAAHAHTGGCAVCGDDDEFSPDAEAFDETGRIVCTPCYAAANAADDDDGPGAIDGGSLSEVY